MIKMAATDIKAPLLNALRQAVADAAAYGEYQINGAWVRTAIAGASVQLNGSTHILIYAYPDAERHPVTGFRILNSNLNVLLERTETIPFAAGDDYMPLRFKVGVTAVDDEEE